MTVVETIAPGRTVKVGPSEPSAADVLLYAEMLIEEEGWHKIDPTARVESGPETGWTLHDAIGEANRRLFPESMGGGGKEGIRISASGETTRQAATKAVKDQLPSTASDDKTFNDKAKSKTAIVNVLRKAREAVTG